MIGHEEYAKNYDSNLIDKQSAIFDSVELGSIVYAILPFSEKKLTAIGDKHQYRPYIVIHKADDVIYAFACSTSNYKTRYKVHVSKRDVLDKSTFIYTGNVYALNSKHLIDFIGSTNPVLLRKIKRLIPFSSQYLEYFDSVPCGCIKGDIIHYKNADYYVFIESESKLYLHPIVPDCHSDYCVPLPENRTEFAGKCIDTNKEVQIPSDSPYEFVTYINDSFVKCIQNTKQLKARVK